MSYFSSIKLVADFLNIPATDLIDFTPTYHKVAQTYCPWPVVINDNGYKIKLFEWGLIANYMSSPEKIKQYRSSMANARAEKLVQDKSSVWHRIRKQRCLVFTTGFFEHRDIGSKKKQPYFITVNGQQIFCFAGLYNYSPIPDKETGEMTGTFAVVTRPANPLMKKIHNAGANNHRMPLILTKELAIQWLSEDLSDEDMAKIVDYEFPASGLNAWPVNSIRVRKEDDENVITPVINLDIPAL